MSSLMRRIHLEDVIVRSLYELVFVGKKERMNGVDELRDVSHHNFISVTIESV